VKLRILLADDHKIVREGLRTLIEKQPGTEVVGEADSGRMALKLTRELKPDVVIMDITMPDLNGIEATRQIHSEIPGVKVIALSMHSDKRLVTGILMAGASGYLLKEDCDSVELARAIQAVASNQTYLSPKIGEVVIKDYMRHLSITTSSPFSILTPREREVLQLLAEGKSTKEIASSLHLSVKTIETHRNKIMEKLDIHSIAELTKYAIRERLTPL
jgi:DNA-binding NarL/FixJ family response regulator